MKREYGFYFVKLLKGDDWSIGQYKGGFMRDGMDLNGWLIIGEEARWESAELFEIGERIPSNEHLKGLRENDQFNAQDQPIK